MKVKELIELVNEKGSNIYQVSIDCGFSKGTLRGRLISMGYNLNKKTGKWSYEGTNENEPLDQIITNTTPSRIINKQSPEKEQVDLFAALIQLPFESEVVTHSYKTDKLLVERLKKFTKKVSLPSGKVCSLAIYEFLEKYEPFIEDLKHYKN